MSITKRKVKGKTQYRFVVSYKDDQGKYKQKASKWYASAAEAKKAESEYRANLTIQKPASGLTVAQALESYAEYKESRICAARLRSVLHDIQYYYSNLLDKPVDQVQAKDILEAHEGIAFQEKATSTKNRIMASLHGFFAYCDKILDIPCDPLKRIEKFVPTDEERLKEFNILTPEQFETLLKNVSGLKPRAALYVLFWTGMRRNECLSLTFEDIHETYIDLRRQYDESTHSWRPLKTKEARRISINPELYSVFETLRDELKTEFPDEFKESWFCFGGPKHISGVGLAQAKNKAIQKAGLPYVRLHDLRHSHASYLIEQGVNVYKISKRLGHASIQITLDRYGHLIDTEGAEILGALNNKAPF